MRGYPGQTPNPSSVSAIIAGGVAIAAGPLGTIIGTAPAIKGGDVPKVIAFTVAITYGGVETVTVTVERDGVAFGSAYLTGSDAVQTLLTTIHWFDATPGKGAPVYTVRAVGGTGAVGTANAGRTITVFNV